MKQPVRFLEKVSSFHDVNFYRNMKPFESFEGFLEDENYQDVPESWFIVIADITGSTKAIESGKYKDVNTLGAACISVVRDVMPDDDYPYVFGGDGASFLIEPSQLARVKDSLLGVKELATKQFGMTLRIGIVPMTEIIRHNQTVRVAKFLLTSTKSIAKIKGGGLSFADKLIKEDPTFLLDGKSKKDTSLTGLSCRWESIPSTHGKILTIIVKAKKEEDYLETWTWLSSILGDDVKSLNPVKQAQMTYRSIWSMIKDEIRFEKLFSRKMLNRVIEIFFAHYLFSNKDKVHSEKIENYKSSMATHSDFRKFDDALRMVLDCSESQIWDIIQVLEDMEKSHGIRFGTHVSQNALMTCLVGGLEDGNHIHFIDGDDGGYALAAKDFKEKK